jgi:hypothetical protein
VHRSLLHRLTGLLVAALLLFSWTGEALGQHACPHHDSVPGAAAHADDGDHAAHGMAAHAPASTSGQDHDRAGQGQNQDQDQGAESEHQHEACTCQGSCPSAASEVFPPDPDAGLRVVPTWVRQARFDDTSAVTLLLLPFFLPYGQAPPLLG